MTSLSVKAPALTPIAARFEGQVALVTGAAGYIGFATVRRFLLEGARVVLVDYDEARLEVARASLTEEFADAAATTLVIRADVSSEAAVAQFVDQTLQRFGRLDCAFLCAGVSYASTGLLETSSGLYDRVMESNCRSSFLGVQHCGRAMKERGGGSIVLASSVAGLQAAPGLAAYSMAKYALRGLCLTAAAELGPLGIRVNTLHPGGVQSAMFEATWPAAERQAMLAQVPLGRWSRVEDMAAVVCFLSSADASMITGGAIKVDGGAILS